MTKIRQYLAQEKPLIAAITYAILLWFLVSSFPQLWQVICRFFGYLKPFFYGIGIAFVLNIPMKQCEQFIRRHASEKSRIYRRRRTWSIVYAFLLAAVLIILFGYLIIPPLIKSIGSFLTNLVSIINGLLSNTDQIISYLNLNPLGLKVDVDEIQSWFSGMGLNWQSIVTKATGYLSSSGSSLISNLTKFSASLGNWFLGLMLSIYMLASKETLIRQAKKLCAAILPTNAALAVLRVCHQANIVFSHFISGQLVEALIIGLLEYLMMLLCRMPYAVLIACIVVVLSLVPVFGATLACIIGFLLVFSVSPLQAVLFVILYQCTQQFENVVIYPRVVGKSVGLPGIWTLLSIVVFGSMNGVFGMLMAVPFTALIYSFGSELINKALKKKHLTVTAEEVRQEPTADASH